MCRRSKWRWIRETEKGVDMGMQRRSNSNGGIMQGGFLD